MRALFLFARAFIATLALHAGAVSAQTATRQTTPGGLAFRHILLSDQPFQSLQFAWPDPIAAAPKGKEALSSLGASMIMRGPTGMTASELSEELNDLQATLSLSNSGRHTRGAVNAPPRSFAEAAALMRRTLTTPGIPPEALATIQRNAAAGVRQAAANPETIARRLLGRLTFGPDYEMLTGADPDAFARIGRVDIFDWARRTFVRTGLEIVVAGPMPASDVATIIDRMFAELPPGEAKPEPPLRPLRVTGKLVLLERPVVQTIIAMAGATTLPIDEHLVRADMLVTVLSGGLQSRLYRSVRERLGAAYGVSASLTPIDAKTIAFSIRTSVANERGKDALAAIRDDYAAFIKEGATAAEIDPLRLRAISNRSEALRRSGSFASLVMNGLLNGLPDDAVGTFASRVAGYPLAAFNADLERHFPKPPLTTVVVAPSADGWGADCVIRTPDEISRCE